jgi:hypothetical protein
MDLKLRSELQAYHTYLKERITAVEMLLEVEGQLTLALDNPKRPVRMKSKAKRPAQPATRRQGGKKRIPVRNGQRTTPSILREWFGKNRGIKIDRERLGKLTGLEPKKAGSALSALRRDGYIVRVARGVYVKR